MDETSNPTSNSNDHEVTLLNEEEDRISQLPDSVLLQILTCLPTFDAVFRAGLVSKRWSSLKNSLPSFVFRPSEMHCPDDNYRHKFANLVDNILLFNAHSNNFQRFCLYFVNNMYYTEYYERKKDTWIRFAVICNVKELELYDESKYYARFYLPEVVFRHEVLTRLSLLNVKFKYSGKEIRWKCLKSLTIKRCKLDDTLLRKMMRGCPILESLELGDCNGIEWLDIDSKSLNELMLNHV